MDRKLREVNPDSPFLSDAERIRLLETNVTDYAIFLIDAQERIASWNAGAARILGYEEAEIIGLPASLLYLSEDQTRGDVEKEFRIARETGHAEDERWHRRKDGSRLWGSGILTALYDERRQLRGYAKILRDFTERKQYAERIEALNARLQWAMTETHHRIKNSLQIISAMIDLQTLGREEAVPVEEYRRLSNQVRALAAVHDILTEDTRSGGDGSTLSVQAVLQKLLSLLQATVGRGRIESQLKATEPALLSTRKASSLTLIVNELVLNALKHSDSAVRVAFSVQAGKARLSICDDGPGFPDGFQAADFAHTGLDLVENLVRLDLQGKTLYENRPEGGGCVTVSFCTDH